MPRLVLLPTNKCNLRCKHCFRYKPEEGKDVPIDIIKKVLKEARELGFRHVALTGGEPFLHKDIDKILNIISSENYTFHIVSNGYAFDKFLPLIARNKHLTRMCLSLDGAAQKTHDTIRGEGSFNKVINSTRLCNENGIPFHITTCINKINFGEYKQIITLSEKLGARRIVFLSALPDEKNKNENIILSKHEKQELFDSLVSIKKEARLKIKIEIVNSIMPFSLFKSCLVYKGGEINLNFDGNLIFCCDLANYAAGECNIYPKKWITIGNLGRYSLKELLPIYRERVKSIQSINCLANKKRSDFITKCEACINSFRMLNNSKGVGAKRECHSCIYYARGCNIAKFVLGNNLNQKDLVN